MSQAHMGARVMYCGHDGWFVADIFKVGTANAVKANGPITADKLVRGRNEEATHHLADFPQAGCWAPDRGLFVVPVKQVRELNRG